MLDECIYLLKILNVIKRYINVIIHRNISNTAQMLTVTPKLSRIQHTSDKQNIQSIANRNDRSLPRKQNIKTGVEIKNKIKSKNLLQHSPICKKNASTDMPSLHEKVQRKILQPKNINDRNCSIEQNISRASSIKSIKSVTFSINGSLSQDSSLGQLSQRKSSILKNKLSRGQLQRNREKPSLASSNGSNSKSLGQNVDNPNSNCIVLRKYERLLKELMQTGQKYTDAIYPPCEQSFFLTSPYTKEFIGKLKSQGYQIKWMRLTELFKGKETCLWHSEKKSTVTRGFIHPTGNESNYMQTVFNCINKSYLMEKFFEGQSVCKQGIYYVKMHQTQTNHWKYVIVDDFVPVIVNSNQGKVIKPAFLNVQSQTNVIQLWPFLVQKAFAKYYSTYDSLMKGNTLDFLQEVTGDLYQVLSQTNQPNEEKNRDRIDQLIHNPYNIILAQNSQVFISPLRYNGEQIDILDSQNNYRPKKIQTSHYQTHFKNFYVIEAKKYTNHINCLIKLQNLLERETQLQESIKPFILRSFTLQESTECTLALTQKQERFHRNLKNTKFYSYSWMRMILIQKQNTGYRWIQSGYQRKKTLKLHACLSPGEYYIVVLPQWSSKPFDLKLSLFSNSETFFQRKSYLHHGRIIEQSCMDLAQRFGKLIQVNSNICSYNYIDYNVGFIIENINNEKTSGEVKILRTIDGLDAYNITPVNTDFGQSSRLEIKIPSLESYTVVLKVSGGVDRSFLQQFDFGI